MNSDRQAIMNFNKNNINWKQQYSFNDLLSSYGNPLYFDFGILQLLVFLDLDSSLILKPQS